MNKLYSPDSEISIIGGLLMDNSAYDRIVDIVRPCMFSDLRNAEIYKAITAILDENKPVDVVTLSDSIDRDIATLGDLVGIVQNVPSAANIKRYAEILKSKWQGRESIRIANESQDLLLESDSDAVEKVLLDHAAQLESLTENNSDSDMTLDNNQSMRLALNQIMKVQDGEEPGLLTGYPDLDVRLTGLKGGEVIIIAGRPAMGKTVLATNIMNNITDSNLTPNNQYALMFSMEMSDKQMSARQLASFTGVELNSIITGRLEDQDYNRIERAAKTQRNILIDYRPGLTVEQIRAKARRVNRKNKLGLIVIDYLQLMSTNKSGETRNAELSHITRCLKNIAKELDIPIIVLSQLSRKVEDRVNKTPMMSDLRDSGAIEQDADVILLMYREEYYNPESINKGVVQVNASKVRQGEPGNVYLAFRGSCMRIENLAHGWSYQQPEETKKAGKGFKLGSAA